MATGDNPCILSVRLSAPELEFWVDVTLHNREERWLAIAMIGGEPYIGTGASALRAMQSALADLGPDVSQLLLQAVPPDLPTG